MTDSPAGYTSESDPRRPSNHVCYECLFGGREDATLEKLHDLVSMRCVYVKRAWAHGLLDPKKTRHAICTGERPERPTRIRFGYEYVLHDWSCGIPAPQKGRLRGRCKGKNHTRGLLMPVIAG